MNAVGNPLETLKTQLEVDVLRELPGTVQPTYRNIAKTLEHYMAMGRKLPWGNTLEMTLSALSLAQGGIALAQTAPHRSGNRGLCAGNHRQGVHNAHAARRMIAHKSLHFALLARNSLSNTG